MESSIKSIKQALNPAFLKQKPNRVEIEFFLLNSLFGRNKTK